MLYFDNAATTKISKQALETYVNASEDFYNPSSLYAPALNSKRLIEDARSFFLKKFKAPIGSTFIFTGSATESNNAVLNSVITRKDKTYIFSAGEHSSIYETAMKYKQCGFNVKFIPLKKNGSVDTEKLFGCLDETVAFVSIIYVSNETGAINDIKEISKQVKAFNQNIIFHTDAVQVLGKLDIDLKELNVDYLTLSAHKINGPKGVGGLYIAKPNKFKPFLVGGGQEYNLRSSTENIPGIMSFKTAVENIQSCDFKQHKKSFLENLKGDFVLISDDNCVDNIISVCFLGVRGETIEHMLEIQGYLIGTGSACNSKLGYNRVLSGIVDKKYIEGAIRISFGQEMSVKDCEELAKLLSNAVKEYRERINK